MRHDLLLLLLAGILSCSLAGCLAAGLAVPTAMGVGNVAGSGMDASFTPSEKLNIDHPLTCDQKEADSIKRLAVISIADKIKDPQDRSIYLVQLNILLSELQKSKRFELVSPMQVKKKQQQLGTEIDITLMTKEEVIEAFNKTVKALNCDGAISIYSRSKPGNAAGNFFRYGFTNRISVDNTLIVSIDMLRNDKTITIYKQEQDYSFTASQTGIAGLQPDDLKKVIAPTVEPLVKNLVTSFPLTVTTQQANPSGDKQADEPKMSSTPATLLVILKTANVRSEPTTKAKTISTLKAGQRVSKIGESGSWLNIQLSSGECGWVSRTLVKETE